MLKKILAYSLPAVGLCSFFFSQAYVVGFLLNVVVPKTIDSGPEGPVGHVLFAAVMTCYVVVGITLEERDLIKVYGERYRSCKQRVGMLLPAWKREFPTDRARPW